MPVSDIAIEAAEEPTAGKKDEKYKDKQNTPCKNVP
jgi:hypothetical protein